MPPQSRTLVRRVVLERASRPLLARLLREHAAAFCAAHAFPIDALETGDRDDRTLVHRLFALLHARDLTPPLPESAAALFARLDALATPAGGDALIRLDTNGVFPRATLGDEDLALTALLLHPAIADAARVATESDRVQGFTEYEMADARPVDFGEPERAALEATLGSLLEELDRTRSCLVHLTRAAGKVSLEIVHARRPKARDLVDPRTLAVATKTDIQTDRAFAELDLPARTVAIHAGVGVKRLVSESLGIVLASDRGFLRAARVYDLAPFADLDAVADVAGVPRLTEVEIHDLAVRTAGGTVITYARPRRDLLADPAAAPLLRAALAVAVPVAVKLYLTIAGRERKLKVELSAKDGKNRLDFDRDDPAVVEIVRGYLRVRGVLRDLTAGAATGTTV